MKRWICVSLQMYILSSIILMFIYLYIYIQYMYMKCMHVQIFVLCLYVSVGYKNLSQSSILSCKIIYFGTMHLCCPTCCRTPFDRTRLTSSHLFIFTWQQKPRTGRQCKMETITLLSCWVLPCHSHCPKEPPRQKPTGDNPG